MSEYATVNPGEFFAVVTEVNFDPPCEMQAQPGLCNVLRDAYRHDQAWRARR